MGFARQSAHKDIFKMKSISIAKLVLTVIAKLAHNLNAINAVLGITFTMESASKNVAVAHISSTIIMEVSADCALPLVQPVQPTTTASPANLDLL